jgi:predicted ATPase
MSNLFLNSLEIQKFRAFDSLRIPRLSRVNLIVGKNNVGKTSLLEALRLYTYQGSPSLIWELLERRDESREPARFLVRDDEERALAIKEERVLSIKHLFYGRKDIRGSLEPIQIGPIDDPQNTLSISVRWGNIQLDRSGRLVQQQSLLDSELDNIISETSPHLEIKIGDRVQFLYPLTRGLRETLYTSELDSLKSIFIYANGLTRAQIGRLWDSISLTNLEDEVLSALRIISDKIERLSLVSDQDSNRNRIPVVRVSGLEGPIPLRSLGEGMNRLFGIALGLVNTRNGVLLIDEVESGLHYSVQLDLWRLIFKLAARLNVQVFATTHSWDCIEGFQKAAQEDITQEGLLIRLGQRREHIVVTLYDENELAVVTREQIEVR